MINNINLQGKILNLNMLKHKLKRDVPHVLRKENLHTTCAKTQKHKLDNSTTWKHAKAAITLCDASKTTFHILHCDAATETNTSPVPHSCFMSEGNRWVSILDPHPGYADRTKLPQGRPVCLV